MYQIFEKLCAAKGVTAYAVSKATGISTATLTSWKQGKYTPKADKLQKIADYFGVPVDYLKTGEMKGGFYVDPETAETARKIAESKELSLLFSEAADASPENLRTTYEILLALKKRERHETE